MLFRSGDVTELIAMTLKNNTDISRKYEPSNCDRMRLELSHPQRSVVASLGNGRLGNQMSNFATCYAISKEYGMYHYLSPNQLHALQKVFVLPDLSNSENVSYFLWEKGKCL